MKIKEIMRPAQILPPDAPVVEAARIMKTEKVGLVPIGTDDCIQGVITPERIATFAVAEGFKPEAARVEEIAVPVIGFCQEEQELSEVLDAMKDHHQSGLLVRGANGKIIGCVTLEDVVQAVA